MFHGGRWHDFFAVTHHTDATIDRQRIRISTPEEDQKAPGSIADGLMGWRYCLGSTGGCCRSRSRLEMPHFGFQRGNFRRCGGRLGLSTDDSCCSSSSLSEHYMRWPVDEKFRGISAVLGNSVAV